MGKTREETKRKKHKKEVTLKTKIPPALSHHFLLDQQKINKKTKMQKNEITHKGNLKYK